MTPYGKYIKLFSIDHIIYIAILLIIAVFLFYKKEYVRNNRNWISKVILLTSIAQQILLYSSYYLLMGFDLGESLPFHISRINSILGIILLISRKEKLFKVFSFFSFYAWTSFLYPSRVYGINHPIGISFIINHVITLLLPYYFMITYDMEIKPKDRNLAFKWFLVYLTFVYFFNPPVDGNYFYLKHKPFFGFLPDFIYIAGVILFTYSLFSIGEFILLKVQNKIRLERMNIIEK